MLLRVILECNVLLITIKGTAVIKPERTAAWLEAADRLNVQAPVKMFSYIYIYTGHNTLNTVGCSLYFLFI